MSEFGGRSLASHILRLTIEQMKNILLAIAAIAVTSAQCYAFSLNGYYENDIVSILKPDGQTLAGDLSRIRLKFDAKPLENIAVHIEPKYYFFIKDQNIPIAGATCLDQTVLDRAYVKYYGPMNLTVGKQRIAWGSGYIWNPTDAFNPFVMSFAVKEDEETNVTAARAELPMGQAGGIDGFVVLDQKWETATKGIRAKTNVGLFDLSASFVDTGSGSSLIGFDFAGDALGAGIRGEAALKSPMGLSNYVQAILGGDYTLDNGVNINLEYYYNGAGTQDKNMYNWTGLYSGAINQLGRDYLFIGANKIINELATGKISMIANLNDQSFLVYPSYTRSISQYVDLSFEGMVTAGTEGSEFKPGTKDTSGFGGSNLAMMRLIYNF